MTKKTIIKTIDSILDESFITREGGISVFKKKIAGLDEDIRNESVVAKTGSSLVLRQKTTGLGKNKLLPNYLQKNPMAQYMIKHFSDAIIHIATGYDDFDSAVYVTGARFGLSDEVAVRLSINAYENRDPAKMVSDRLGDIYAGMWLGGLGEPFFNKGNFIVMTSFLKKDLLGYLAALEVHQKRLPLAPKLITHQGYKTAFLPK